MSLTFASKIGFVKLCNALEKISNAKSAKKAEILQSFIDHCRDGRQKMRAESPNMDVSLFPIMRLILPHLERERGPHNLKEKSLANLYVRVLCLGKGSKDANKLVHYKTPTSNKSAGSDFAERAYAVLRNRLPPESGEFTIEQINMFLDDISKKNETTQEKDELFKILLGKTNALEFKWITRIILKDVKLGIGNKKILQAFHPDANSLFDVSSNLREVCDKLHDPRVRYQPDIKIFSHCKPMLLERLKIEDAEKLFIKGDKYFVQSKFDGERSQVHMKDGTYKYFTRQGFDITNNAGYGETSSSGFLSGVFDRLLNSDCKSIILDGELMGWHKEKKLLGSKGMNFDVKKLSKTSHHQPCFVGFDIIMYNDILLTSKPYEERLNLLKDAFTEEEGCLMLCKSTKISNSLELTEMFNESMRNEEEGIVLKKCDVTYKPNVRDKSGCYKMKAEYSDDLVQDVDLIILGGYYGTGRCIGIMKSFLMGVASPSDTVGGKPSKFLSVVSVSNGISMENLRMLWEKFEGKWKSGCPSNVTPPRLDPPDLWIQPEDSVILTLRATEMTRSNDYPTGYSLRFPRVMNVRSDKPWYSVCTTAELLSLIKNAKPIQKLTKREVNHADVEEPSASKSRKLSNPPTKSEGKPTRTSIYDDPPVPISRLLDGKELCVINGDSEFPKERIEEILMQHRAKVVQVPLNADCCVVIGNARTAKANNILRSRKYDVVGLDWFKRVTKEENWAALRDFLPWELLCSRETTKLRLAEKFDEYYENFIAGESDGFQQLVDEAGETESKKFFDEGIPPYSTFRDIVGYFDDQADRAAVQFRFMEGTIKRTIDDFVTHVFVGGSSTSSALQSLVEYRQERSIKIVRSDWITESFRNKKLLPIENYLIRETIES